MKVQNFNKKTWQEAPQIEALPEDEALRCVLGDL